LWAFAQKVSGGKQKLVEGAVGQVGWYMDAPDLHLRNIVLSNQKTPTNQPSLIGVWCD